MLALPAMALLALLSGCLAGTEAVEAPTGADVAETAPGSLQVDVAYYRWALSSSKTQIKIYGEVVNNSGAPIHGVILSATLFNSEGKALASGESYVAPTYLPAGGKGTFEFIALTKRPSNIGATKLVTSARPLSAY
jgi:hypothetical protein